MLTIRFPVFLILLLSVCFSFAQSSRLGNDAEALQQILKKTHSFRQQIKGKALKDFEALLSSLRSDTIQDVSGYAYFEKLARLFFPIRDNHLGFYQVPDPAVFNDSMAYAAFRQTRDANSFPVHSFNMDSLERVLQTKPMNSIEGIYQLDTLLTVGVIRTHTNQYEAIVLASRILLWWKPVWQRGQRAFTLFEQQPGFFKAIYAHPLTKTWMLQPNERFENNSLIHSDFYGVFYGKNYTKNSSATAFVNLPADRADYSFKTLTTDVQYLQIRHFSADPAKMKKAALFMDSLKAIPKTTDLILDLRNNQGGANKVSKQFKKFIRPYLRKGHVYVLVNGKTISQGEIFTLQLKKHRRVQVLGQTTSGTLTYGSNYGKTLTLPASSLQVYPTDMGGRKRLLKLEGRGIAPDIVLQNDRDWVEQVLARIQREKTGAAAGKKVP